MERYTQQRQQFSLKKGVEKAIILLKPVTTDGSEFQIEYPAFHPSQDKSLYARLYNAFGRGVGKPVCLIEDGITKFNMVTDLEEYRDEYLFLTLKPDCDITVSLTVFENTEATFF